MRETSERLRSPAGLFDEADAARTRPDVRADRANHRRRAAARGAARLMVGAAAQPAGEDAAAGGLPGGRLHRDKAGGREKREVQEDEMSVERQVVRSLKS